MDERKDQIIKGFNEAYNKVNVIRTYINIFNIYEEKLKKEFKRLEIYMADEDYNNNLERINTIDLIELEKIIKAHIESFKNMDNLRDTSEQYVTFIICLLYTSIDNENNIKRKVKMYIKIDSSEFNLWNLFLYSLYRKSDH